MPRARWFVVGFLVVAALVGGILNARGPDGRYGGSAAVNWVGDVYDVAGGGIGRVNHGNYAVVDLSGYVYLDAAQHHRLGVRIENAFDADYDTRIIRVRRDLEEVIGWTRAQGLLSDACVRRTLAELAVDVCEVEAHALRVLDAMQRGRPAVAEAAANKVVHSVACQKIARAALDFGGPEALVHGARVELLWRQSLWETIGGGTSEIMRGVIAKQALGLGGGA